MRMTKYGLKDLIREVLSEVDPDALKQVRGVSGQQLAGKMLSAPGVERLIPIVQKAQDLQKVDFLVYMASQIGVTNLKSLASMISRAEKRMGSATRPETPVGAATGSMEEGTNDFSRPIDEIAPKTKFEPKGFIGIEKLAAKNRELLTSLADQLEFDDNTPAGRVLAAIEMNNQAIINAADLAKAGREMATYLAGNPEEDARISKKMTARQGE